MLTANIHSNEHYNFGDNSFGDNSTVNYNKKELETGTSDKSWGVYDPEEPENRLKIQSQLLAHNPNLTKNHSYNLLAQNREPGLQDLSCTTPNELSVIYRGEGMEPSPLNNSPVITIDNYQIPGEVSEENGSQAFNTISSNKILGAERVDGYPALPYKAGASWGEAFCRGVQSESRLLWSDTKNFYTWSNAGNYGLMLGAMGIVANTSMDQHFSDWYQSNVRSSGTDSVSNVVTHIGNGYYVIPVLVAGTLCYRFMEQKTGFNEDSDCYVGNVFSRSLRATIVGAPTLLIGQAVLGGGRPNSGSESSHWHLFKSPNAISGHSYIGAIPFITMAQMTDNYWLKSSLYFGSTLPAWSRVNDDVHYLSQVILGWYLAYLSVRAVSQTEQSEPLARGLTLFPLFTKESTSLGISYAY